MPIATSVTVHVVTQQILSMSNHIELKDLRSEGIYFKNKYKFMMLKSAIVPQINEAFVRSQRKHTSTLQYPFGFCSDASFIDTIFSTNWYLSFVLGLLISHLTFVFLLLALLVSVLPDISKIHFRFTSENGLPHKYAIPNIKHIWRTN
jgi:hypothetical protein